MTRIDREIEAERARVRVWLQQQPRDWLTRCAVNEAARGVAALADGSDISTGVYFLRESFRYAAALLDAPAAPPTGREFWIVVQTTGLREVREASSRPTHDPLGEPAAFVVGPYLWRARAVEDARQLSAVQLRALVAAGLG